MGQKNRTEENSGNSPFHPLGNKFPYIQKGYLEWRAPFSDTLAQKHMKTMKAPQQFIENPFVYRLMFFFPVYGFCRVHVNTVQVHSKMQDSQVSKLTWHQPEAVSQHRSVLRSPLSHSENLI
mgnify:CR=1 FL=1